MTLSEILDAVLLQSGVTTEDAYATSSDDEVLRLVALANREVQKLVRWPWQALRGIYTFTLTSETEYSLPTDFGWFIPDTMFSDEDQMGVDFPTGPSEWVYLKVNDSGTDRIKARIMGDQIRVNDPTTGTNIQIEYVSKYPVLSSASVEKEYFTADDDTTKLDDELLIHYLTAAYKRMMGQEWQADLAFAKEYEQKVKGQDGSAKTVGPCEDGFVTPYYDLWRPVPNT